MNKNLLLFSFLVIITITITWLIPKSNIPPFSTPKSSFLDNHFFYVICTHEKNDPFFIQQIQSLLNQDYSSMQIILFIDTEHKNILNKLSIYAKKLNKSHLLEIIDYKENTPICHLIHDRIKKITKNDILIFLKAQCYLSQNSIIKKINSIYNVSTIPIVIYSNHTQYPSLQTNSKKVTYENSYLKTAYVKNIHSIKEKEITNHSMVSFFSSIDKNHQYKKLFLKEGSYLLAR